MKSENSGQVYKKVLLVTLRYVVIWRHKEVKGFVQIYDRGDCQALQRDGEDGAVLRFQKPAGAQ